MRTVTSRIIGICLIGCIAVSAVVHLSVFEAAQEAVDRSMRRDMSWIGSNGRIEAAHLEKYVARYAALGAEEDRRNAILYYSILLSRLDTWDSGVFGAFIDETDKRSVSFRTLRNNIEALEPKFARLEDASASQTILHVLSQASVDLERIGAKAHTYSILESEEIRAEMLDQLSIQRWLILALIAGGTLLLGITMSQNKSLTNANRIVARNASEFAFLARHDALTALPTRSTFDEQLVSAELDVPSTEWLGVFALDLDGFKAVNDNLGHAAGDALLKVAAEIVRSYSKSLDERNVVARAGGDEFLILVHLGETPAQALASANELLARLQRPVETSYGTHVIGATIGIAVAQGGSSEISELALNADTALTQAKSAKKGEALVFEPSMKARLQRRLKIETALVGAISRGEVRPHYQPQFDLKSGECCGMEALARWNDPELGHVPPDEFVPVAEACGAINQLGEAILLQACKDACKLPPHIKVAVNLSVLQILHGDVVNSVSNILAKTGLPADRLKLEVTESVLMSDFRQVTKCLKELQALGVAISLDDFGTGYSALSYLTKFRWDELKIDRSFVDRALDDPLTLMIVRMVKVIAQTMRATLTVEGIETPEQKEAFALIGCATAQGYHFGRPVPFSDLVSQHDLDIEEAPALRA